MAMAATEIDRNGDVAELKFKSSPNVSMDGLQEDHSQALDSFDNDTPALTMETSTCASSTASQHDDNEGEGDNDLEELVEIDENSVSVIEEICPVDGPCVQCEIEQPCSFRFTDNGATLYVCNEPCIKAYQEEYPGKYTVRRKKYLIEEITPKTLLCSECEEIKTCYFYYNFYGEDMFYCSINCLEVMMADEKDKYAFKRVRVTIDQIRPKEGQCLICEQVKPCEFSLVRYGEPRLLCGRTCIKILSGRERGRYYIKKLRVTKPAISNAIDKNLDEGYKIQEKSAAMFQREQSCHRRCSQCTLILMIDENVLTWEAMDFCDEICLERFQNGIGSRCAKCNNLVQHTSLGKYCVRFGYDIRQFCDSSCLEQFKKGLKICCYCQRDISASTQVFRARVGDKGQFKDFCTQSCVEKFDEMSKNPVPQPVWAKCAVCSLEKATTIEIEVTETTSQRICSDPCFAAYKFVSNILPDQCNWCKKYFERKSTKSFTTYDDSNPNCFCSQSCMTIHINHTKFTVSCNWCKSQKYNVDMIRRVDNGQAVFVCSLNCMSLFQESVNALSSSNGVPPPTLAPPVPSIEQGRADMTVLAAEQLITLTKSRKRRETTPSSNRKVHSNESPKKVRFAIPAPPLSGRKQEARSSSLVGKSNAPALRKLTLHAPSPAPSSTHVDIADIVNGSDGEDSDGENTEESGPSVSAPRTARLQLQDMDEEMQDEFVDIQNSSRSPLLAQSPLPELGRRTNRCSPILIEVPGSFDGGKEIGDRSIVIDMFMSDVQIYAPTQPPSERAVRGCRIRRRGGRPRGRGRIGSRRPSSRDTALRAASTREHTWTTGDPIVQVCLNDDDVPEPLRNMVRQARDTMAARQARDTMAARQARDTMAARQARDTMAARQARRQERQQRLDQDDEDVWYDADDSREAVLLDGSNDFEWMPMDTFVPRRETFTPERTGSVETHNTIYDAFRSYWDDGILGEIVTETNRYAARITAPTFRRQWFDTNVHEILVLFAFWMMLGIIKMPTIKSCFSTHPLLSTEVFRKMFSQKRYANLARALHFANDDARPQNASRLYCFGRVLDHMNEKFSNHYIPGPNISIDESLTLWKGVLLFRQYIRTKAARFGIKTFELCDSVTGYLWSFVVYTGKDHNAQPAQHSGLLKSTSVVLELVQPLLHKGYRIFMDNWYNSPTLARFLKANGTDCVGTLRSSRCGVPALIQQANLQRGQLIARHSGDLCVMAWQDKRKVITISTCHDATVEPISNGIVTQWKPRVILDYNKYMGGVDRKDQMLEPYLLERKRGKKWYIKLFKRILNASILNSRILLESSSGRQEDHLACRLCLVHVIMKKHLHLIPVNHTPQRSGTLARLDTRHVHWPVRIEQSNAPSDQGRRTRMRCVLCMQRGLKNKRTTYKCEHCNVPLCIDTCFKPYHTV